MDLIGAIEAEQLKYGLPDFGPGDTVRVGVGVREAGQERVQAFERTVISRRVSRRASTAST